MTRGRGVRPHHISLGYAAFAVTLGLLAVPLAGNYGLLLVTLPMLVVAGLTMFAGLIGRAAPLAGTALTVSLFLAVAAFFALVERAYDPDGSRRETALRDIGSAMENNVFAHAPAALAVLHLLLAFAALLPRATPERGSRES